MRIFRSLAVDQRKKNKGGKKERLMKNTLNNGDLIAQYLGMVGGSPI